MSRTIIYKPVPNRVLTPEEIQMLDALEDRPIVFDEDCPELTPAADAALIEARRRKPLKGVTPEASQQTHICGTESYYGKLPSLPDGMTIQREMRVNPAAHMK